MKRAVALCWRIMVSCLPRPLFYLYLFHVIIYVLCSYVSRSVTFSHHMTSGATPTSPIVRSTGRVPPTPGFVSPSLSHSYPLPRPSLVSHASNSVSLPVTPNLRISSSIPESPKSLQVSPYLFSYLRLLRI